MFIIFTLIRVLARIKYKRNINLECKELYLDILILILLIVKYYYYEKIENLKNRHIIPIIEEYFKNSISNTNLTDNENYLSLFDIENKKFISNKIYVLLIVLLIYRISFMTTSSPTINFYWVYLIYSLKKIYYLISFMLLSIISFSMVCYIVLGNNVEIYSNLETAIDINLYFILGFNNSKYFRDCKLVYTIILNCLFYFYKFIVVSFIYGIVRNNYINCKVKYNKYVEKEHYKILKEPWIDYLKYIIFPFGIYFILRDLYISKNIFKNYKKEDLLNKRTNFNEIVIIIDSIAIIYIH